MGICQSCLYGEPELAEENEQTGLLRDPQPVYAATKDTDMKDRKKHERVLKNIVNFTGRNLIDVTSAEVEDFAINGRSATEYKQALEALVEELPAEEPLTKFDNHLSLKLKRSQVDWLNKLAMGAEEAIQKEPRIAPVGDLVQTFG
jgi:hypothetical protein